MKPYNILEPEDVIQKGDECFATAIWVPLLPHHISDYPVVEADFRPIRRPIPQPQWQTGTIPEPTELCVVVIEHHDQESPIIIQSIGHNNYWYWDKCGDEELSPNQVLAKEYTTGRWYIQPIILPL